MRGRLNEEFPLIFIRITKLLPGPKCSLPWRWDGWHESLEAGWFLSEKTNLTCCVDLGVPRARVELIWDTVAVVVPEASVSCSIMVVVHLLWICDKWAVVLKVWNSVVVSIWITVVANAILVGIQLVGVVGIRAVVILVGDPI